MHDWTQLLEGLFLHHLLTLCLELVLIPCNLFLLNAITFNRECMLNETRNPLLQMVPSRTTFALMESPGITYSPDLFTVRRDRNAVTGLNSIWSMDLHRIWNLDALRNDLDKGRGMRMVFWSDKGYKQRPKGTTSHEEGRVNVFELQSQVLF